MAHRNVDRADRPDRTRNDRLPIGDRPSPVAGGRSQAPTAGDRRSTKPTRMVSARAAGRRAEGDHRVFRGQDRTARTRGEPHADTAPAGPYRRSDEHPTVLQSLTRNTYALYSLKTNTPEHVCMKQK